MTYTTNAKTLILSTTTIALLTAMLAPNGAFAHSSIWYGGSPLPNGDAEFYFHCPTLNKLSVDGDRTNNCYKVKTEVQQSMKTYNGLGNSIDLTTTNTYGLNDYVIYGSNMGLWGYSAEATYPNVFGEDYVRYNTQRDFGTSGSCFLWYAYNIEWVTNHEFGHTVGLLHANSGEASTMLHECTSYWSDIQSHDESVLDSHY